MAPRFLNSDRQDGWTQTATGPSLAVGQTYDDIHKKKRKIGNACLAGSITRRRLSASEFRRGARYSCSEGQQAYGVMLTAGDNSAR